MLSPASAVRLPGKSMPKKARVSRAAAVRRSPEAAPRAGLFHGIFCLPELGRIVFWLRLQRLSCQIALYAAVIGKLQLIKRNGDAFLADTEKSANIDDRQLLVRARVYYHFIDFADFLALLTYDGLTDDLVSAQGGQFVDGAVLRSREGSILVRALLGLLQPLLSLRLPIRHGIGSAIRLLGVIHGRAFGFRRIGIARVTGIASGYANRESAASQDCKI
jgi:hypothetical protein